MIRIIARRDNAGMAVNVGGSVHTILRIFDIRLPELERWLEGAGPLSHAQVIGVEIVKDEDP